MEYNALLEKVKRNELTHEEAKEYLGEEFGTTTFIKSTVIHPKFVIGYLDVKEKKFITNEQFYQLDELKNYIPVSNPETR